MGLNIYKFNVRACLGALAYGVIWSSPLIIIDRAIAVDGVQRAIPLGRRDMIAQQPSSPNIDKANADRLFEEGLQLYKQQTIESLKEAIKKWEEAGKIYHDLGDRSGEANTLNNIGLVYNSWGEKQKALDFYNQSLPLSRAVGDRSGEANTLNNIGNVYNDLGEKQKALDFYNQSLPLKRAVGDRSGEANTLGNIGNVYNSWGEKQKALDFYNQSLPLKRAVGDRSGEAKTLNNIGNVYNSWGEKQKALDFYNQSLPLFRAVGDRSGEANTLIGIGNVYNSWGEKQKALDFYNQSLPLSRAVGDRSGEANTLIGIGLVYNDLGEKQKALDFYNQSLPLFRAVGDRSGEANTLIGIGNVYNSWGEKQKALDFYNQSLPLSRAVGDRSGEANTLNNIGIVYNDLGEKQKALDFYNQSLPLSRAVGDRSVEAKTLNNIGNVYNDLGEKQKALDFYNQSLPLFWAVGDRSGEASTLIGIGNVYNSWGEKQKALDFYNQSLPLSRAVGDRSGEASTLIGIGLVYNDLGEKQKALDFYNQSLPLSRAVGDRSGEANTLNNIGLVYNDLGEKQKALDFYNQSLPLSRAVGDRSGEANTLNNIGLVYDDLGEKQKALDFYNQSLPLSRAVGDRSGEANTLIGIGNVYNSWGEKQKALDFYNQSLPLSRAVGDRSGEASTLGNIGNVYSDLGEKQKALDFYNQSLPLSRAVGDRSGEASTLNNIGSVYSDLGEKQKALDFYNQSLPLSRAVGDRTGEAITLFNQAQLKRSQGNLQESRSDIENAVHIIEDLRTKIASPDSRISYFATVQDYYKFYIDLLMQLHKQHPSQGFDAQALEASDRSRARGLIELLTEAKAKITTGVDPKLLEQEQNIQFKIDAFEKNRLKILNGNPTQEQKDELQQQEEKLLEEYKNNLDEIRTNSPSYASLKYPQPLTLAEIQQNVLDDNTLLLQYSLGSDRSYIWAVTKTEITSYELSKGEKEIEKLAKAFINEISGSSGPYDANLLYNIKTANQLSEAILKPVAAKLGNKRLLIVGDGVLQTIPFSVLATPGKTQYTPLLLDHEIVMSPSASTISIIRSDRATHQIASKLLAMFADPVFNNNNDQRFGNTPSSHTAENNQDRGRTGELERAIRDIGGNLKRLPYTRTEADSIMAILDSKDQGQELLDFSANLNAVNSPTLNQYQIVHFATHGIIDNEHPELSGIVLSLYDQQGNPQNGYLRLNEIFNLQLNAELVVLSACKTGLGTEVKGEGLVGLTRGFMYAGSPRVLVSLWSVEDKATAELMKKFYQKMLQEKLTPAAALKAAQFDMWNEKKYTPYHWAAFTMQGEWR